jgi:transposase
MAVWLKERKVESIAIESTGVYWIPAHEVLEAAGVELLLVNTRQLKQVPGRDKKALQGVLSEYGPDLSRFPAEKQFASHIRLARYSPSGGKPVKKKMRRGTSSRTATVLRMAALPQRNAHTA